MKKNNHIPFNAQNIDWDTWTLFALKDWNKNRFKIWSWCYYNTTQRWTDNASQWSQLTLDENVNGVLIIGFECPEDAMAFKLQWL